MHDVIVDLRQSIGISVRSEFDKVIDAVAKMSTDTVALLDGSYNGSSLNLQKAILISLSKSIIERKDLERASEVIELIFEKMEDSKLIERRDKKIIIVTSFRNQLSSLGSEPDDGVTIKINAALMRLCGNSVVSNNAVVGAALILLIAQCGVVTRASLRASLASLLEPIQAVNNWWWLDLHHRQENGVSLELRRVFLPAGVGAFLIRHSDRIKAGIADQNCLNNAFIENVIKQFQDEAGIASPFSLASVLSAYRYHYTKVLPGFLLGYAIRDVESHSLSASQWLRMNGVTGYGAEDAVSHGVAYADLCKSVRERVFDDRPIQLLLLACQNPSELDAFINMTSGTVHWVARWARHINVRTLRPVLVRLLYPWISDVLDGLKSEDYTFQKIEVLREYGLEVAAFESSKTLELCADFWNWMIDEVDTSAQPSRQSGVRPNALSPKENSSLISFANSSKTGIINDSLRNAVAHEIGLSATTGGRRSEVMFLRCQDFQGEDNQLSILIEPHELRSLKSPASKRVIPGLFLSAQLIEKMQALKAPLQPADIMLRRQTEAGLRSVETIFQKANDLIKKLFGLGISLHHLRHSFATWLLIQLNFELLDLHKFKGRCKILDDVFSDAPKKLEILGISHLTRRALWAVAGVLGHVNSLVTCKSYIHSMDLLMFMANPLWLRRGYVHEISVLSGLSYDTVKKHFYRCKPDCYSILHRMEKDYPLAVRRFLPSLPDASEADIPVSVSSLRSIEYESSLIASDDDRKSWPSLVGPRAEAEAAALCQFISKGLAKNPEITLRTLQLMASRVHCNGFIGISEGIDRQIFREGMMACGIIPSLLELAVEKNGKFSRFTKIDHWSAFTRAKAHVWVRFAPLAGMSRSAVALLWVLRWAPLAIISSSHNSF